ncbi:hypothetical protein AB0L85_23535 [Streptomyces sp. NPDC052051]|uniref:hypothetical protein n=1 Tax=Streptomyces sp. NPDC052051 TaxID=3154649 RepID=UPI003427C222
MAITDELITELRGRATAGDPRAALELGKLLCLTASNPADPEPPGRRPYPARPSLSSSTRQQTM